MDATGRKKNRFIETENFKSWIAHYPGNKAH